MEDVHPQNTIEQNSHLDKLPQSQDFTRSSLLVCKSMEEHFEISCDGERGIGEEGGDGVGKVGREDGEDEQGGGKVGTVQGEDLREEVVIGKAGRVEGEVAGASTPPLARMVKRKWLERPIRGSR